MDLINQAIGSEINEKNNLINIKHQKNLEVLKSKNKRKGTAVQAEG